MSKSIHEINEMLKATRDQKFRKQSQNQIDRVNALTGVHRPEQSTRMSGVGNPMFGKDHPSKGKKVPKVGDKLRGKSKPEGFGEKISKARKGISNVKA